MPLIGAATDNPLPEAIPVAEQKLIALEIGPLFNLRQTVRPSHGHRKSPMTGSLSRKAPRVHWLRGSRAPGPAASSILDMIGPKLPDALQPRRQHTPATALSGLPLFALTAICTHLVVSGSQTLFTTASVIIG
jgi:hypothetical protein